MSTFELSLLATGIDAEDFDQLEALAEVVERSHVTRFEGQTRVVSVLEGTSITRTVADFVAAVRERIPGFVPTRAELNLATISDIADHVGLNRESVRLWTLGKRGPGDFPLPLSAVAGGRTRVWTWSDVEEWLKRQHLPVGEARSLSLEEVADINRHLDCLGIAVLPAREWRPAGQHRLAMSVTHVAGWKAAV